MNAENDGETPVKLNWTWTWGGTEKEALFDLERSPLKVPRLGQALCSPDKLQSEFLAVLRIVIPVRKVTSEGGLGPPTRRLSFRSSSRVPDPTLEPELSGVHQCRACLWAGAANISEKPRNKSDLK